MFYVFRYVFEYNLCEMLNENENVNCDFDFYDYNHLCNGYSYPQPYPTPSPCPTVLYLNGISNKLSRIDILECVFNGIGFDYGLHVCACDFNEYTHDVLSPTPSHVPSYTAPHPALLYLDGIDTELAGNNVLRFIFGVGLCENNIIEINNGISNNCT